MFVLIFTATTVSETLLILRSTERNMVKMCIGLHVKYPLFSPDFNDNQVLSTDIRKILKYEISWNSF